MNFVKIELGAHQLVHIFAERRHLPCPPMDGELLSFRKGVFVMEDVIRVLTLISLLLQLIAVIIDMIK